MADDKQVTMEQLLKEARAKGPSPTLAELVAENKARRDPDWKPRPENLEEPTGRCGKCRWIMRLNRAGLCFDCRRR